MIFLNEGIELLARQVHRELLRPPLSKNCRLGFSPDRSSGIQVQLQDDGLAPAAEGLTQSRSITTFQVSPNELPTLLGNGSASSWGAVMLIDRPVRLKVIVKKNPEEGHCHLERQGAG